MIIFSELHIETKEALCHTKQPTKAQNLSQTQTHTDTKSG